MKIRAKFIAVAGAAIALISFSYVVASLFVPEVERGVVGLRLVATYENLVSEDKRSISVI